MATTILSLCVALPMAAIGLHQFINSKKHTRKISVSNMSIPRSSCNLEPDAKRAASVPLPNVRKQAPMLSNPLYAGRPSNCLSGAYKIDRPQEYSFRQIRGSGPVPIQTNFVTERATFDHSNCSQNDIPLSSGSFMVSKPRVDMPDVQNCDCFTEKQLKDHKYAKKSFVRVNENEYTECAPSGRQSNMKRLQVKDNKGNFTEHASSKLLKPKIVYHKQACYRKDSSDKHAMAEPKIAPLKSSVRGAPSFRKYRPQGNRDIDVADDRRIKMNLCKKSVVRSKRILKTDATKKRDESQDMLNRPKTLTRINRYNSSRSNVSFKDMSRDNTSELADYAPIGRSGKKI